MFIPGSQIKPPMLGQLGIIQFWWLLAVGWLKIWHWFLLFLWTTNSPSTAWCIYCSTRTNCVLWFSTRNVQSQNPRRGPWQDDKDDTFTTRCCPDLQRRCSLPHIFDLRNRRKCLVRETRKWSGKLRKIALPETCLPVRCRRVPIQSHFQLTANPLAVFLQVGRYCRPQRPPAFGRPRRFQKVVAEA